MKKNTESSLDELFLKLISIMKSLRAPGGCPWDIEQTHQSLSKYCIEEAFEVVDAIDQKNDPLLCEELGDLLLQVVFHAQLGQDRKAFEMRDILFTLNEKLIRRHPHVFPDETGTTVTVSNSQDVAKNWEAIKQKEGKKNALEGVPRQMPALLRSMRLGEKAAQVGFDWKNSKDVFKKIKEELVEVEAVVEDKEALNEELGDLLFAVAQFARHKEIDAEESLRLATLKFEARFLKMDALAKEQGETFKNLSFEAQDSLWNEVKKREKIAS